VIDLERRKLGPESVGYRLSNDARVFGGNTWTATDCAVALGWMDLGDRSRVTDVTGAELDWFRAESRRLIESAIDRMKSRAGDVPLIAVGGGAPLIPDSLAGVSEIITVDHHDVANAVGAAIAQISGEVDWIFNDVGRNEAIDQATRSAFERAIENGADPDSLAVVEVEDMPLAYMAGNSRRVRVRVAGDMQ
jgi:N-methylhydantoinase A/oxoprolinase/acetone carboxylase beta subunit